MNNDEFIEYEDRAYINPTLSSGEQEAFISNLRDAQKQNNAQIAEQTYNLGTAVPSNLGGLGGGEAYFTSRYQTPQVNEMADTLKAAAQAQALSDVMNNYQTQLQNRYKQAYRAAQSRARKRSGGTGGTGTTGGNTSGWDGNTSTTPTDNDNSKTTTTAPPDKSKMLVDDDKYKGLSPYWKNVLKQINGEPTYLVTN